ncbi:MAG: hypothetical protein EA357_03515 [Micavibrio sp.]|nr:MAG: hypothetical protein EA357_03515 [Micavibrio sp.]
MAATQHTAGGLKAVFSSLLLGGCAAFSHNVLADGDSENAEPQNGTDAPHRQNYDPDAYQDRPLFSLQPPPRRQGVEDSLEDFFQNKPKIHATRNSIFVTPRQRYDLPFLPDNLGAMTVTRQYLEVRPLNKEWYGLASGIEYGFRSSFGTVQIGDNPENEWHIRSGATLGYYDNPDLRQKDNTRIQGFVEGHRDLLLFRGQTETDAVLGISYDYRSGAAQTGRNDLRLYTGLEFPSLFNGKSRTGGDSSLPGRFHGTVTTYAGTESYGGRIGIYFNQLKSDKGVVNFSIGPEVRHDSKDGASVKLRVRVSPRF